LGKVTATAGSVVGFRFSIFPLQRTAERYNAAAAAMTAAAKRLNELDDERRQMAQSQQVGRQQFVKGK
jgi:hypothetical protein